ncbi:Alpha-2-macroglobulin family protein [Hymenobacter arizonensis]|uniref:Alpha-2-macroglobulin family protein n=2 Tax=Hymenobacter arizonensis TaxID=1227077 RepID=A0A1I5Y187_HYMAR|nr:Alpha-2-macroglobulin family protein [Hymenobacter arizonensis]
MIFSPDSAAPTPPDPYVAQWKKIDALLAKSQTTTAAPLVEAIYQSARKAQHTPAYVRALLYKIRLLQAKEEDETEKGIALLETELKTATFPARPIVHSLLAELYTTYLNHNRYRLYQRTAGASATTGPTASADAGTGLATWDMGKLGAAIVRHYYQSVEDEPQRQLDVSLATLGDLAAGGDTEGRALRPSLYDLLAHRAIEGLQNQELYVTRPEQQFQPTEPKLFGTAAEFAALRLLAPEADSLNGQLHALHLLQRLTASRQQLTPPNKEALADVDLQRIDYLRSITQNTDLADQYEPALVRMAATYQGLPISTQFIARRAELLRETNPVAAVALTREAEARFPKSRGAARARQLRAEIEQPELSLSAAEMVVPGQPWRFDVKVRNINGLHAWAYRLTLKEWESFGKMQYGRPRDVAAYNARIRKATEVAAWTIPVVPQPKEYREQQVAATGAALPIGYYLIAISSQSTDVTHPTPQSATSYVLVGASELSVVNRFSPATGAAQMLFLQRQSGAPLSGVKVRGTFNRFNPIQRKHISRASELRTTGATGEVELPAPASAVDNAGEERLISARAWRGADTLLVEGVGGYYPGQYPERTETTCFLFTDRAIYRPGQTVYFKGILVERKGGQTKLLTREEQDVELNDVNGQTVQTLKFVTNSYGSFNGSFVLPSGLLNGEFTLQADDGELRFAVEDYKRPTFFVALDSVPGRLQLGQPLTMGGRVQAYSGQATDAATVSYRVTRRELWPMFDFGFRPGMYPPGRGSSQEIAHGAATTDAAGRFSVTFTPPLVPKVPGRGRTGRPDWEPGYLFEVVADVTDAAGETRTGTRSFPIGRNPLGLRLAGPQQANKQQLPTFTLLATNATGEPMVAAGTLRLLARRYRPNPPGVPGPVLETPENEAAPELISTVPFDTKPGSNLDLAAALTALPAGRYLLEAQAAGPDSARARHNFTLFDSNAATVPYSTPDWFVSLSERVAPGQPASILLGSSEAGARILVQSERNGKLLYKEWLTLKAGEQRRLALASGPATASGPMHIHTIQVRDNQLYCHEAVVQVAEEPQPLKLDISTFRDKLRPGQNETWRVTIRQANGKAANAELLATLYDQSLDIFRPHQFGTLRLEAGHSQPHFGWQGYFGQAHWLGTTGRNASSLGEESIQYPLLNTWSAFGGGIERQLAGRVAGVRIRGAAGGAPAPVMMEEVADSQSLNEVVVTGFGMGNQKRSDMTGSLTTTSPAVDLSAVQARTDFREIAFWQPALHTDRNGDIVLEFQMPEAVTRWQLLALAHDKDLHTGQLARQLVTQKEIQITPNAPRFFRQGDTFTFTAKFSNLTAQPVSGTTQLFLLDTATGQDITSQLLKGNAQQPAVAAANQSAALGWEISLPADFAPVAVTYRVVASATSSAAGAEKLTSQQKKQAKRKNKKGQEIDNQQLTSTFTDGEENTLPVLPNRVLVTESLPLPIVGPGTRTFELSKLTSTSSPTRRNYSLTLEMTANPAWYAVQSLPYLMEYPYECSEQIFSRLYANLLAAQILKSNPRFKTMLAEWARQAQSGTAAQKNALASKLAQNEDLKNLLLQETPWVRDAQGETERQARLTELFDATRLQGETSRALLKLQSMQLPGGGFPWFEKMPEDRYITQLIVAGFGKLKKLGAFDASADPVGRQVLQEALQYLDGSLARDYATLRKQKNVKLAVNHLRDLHIQALYARSFWPQLAEAPTSKTAHAYYRGQAATFWPDQTRYLQAQVALALFRESKAAPAAREILRALAENALHSPELGMYWKEVRGGYYWREAPTETQATLIEAFHEVRNDQKSVDEMKLWLLKQKQTHHWESTRATADACYALLLRGSDWLAPTQPLKMTVGSETIWPEAQAGTGYFKASWPAAEVRPAQGKVTIAKTDAGVSWGALYWQYFEELDKLMPAATPLSLERQLYRETRTASGTALEKVSATTPLKVGEALVVRLVLRTDHALEYVHLKDQRAAGLEPIAQTSGYRYQNGLGYYESPRDAATNFFLGAVPRGTHVFEYRLRAAQAGDFSGGLSEVQCLYAPEFRAHSAGLRLRMTR